MTKVYLPNDRVLTIENREYDGFFRRSGILQAWKTEYFAKKELRVQKRKLGLSERDAVHHDSTGKYEQRPDALAPDFR